MKNYPEWVCAECGMRASGGRCFEISTYHIGKCDVCGKECMVTQPRDFYYPEFNVACHRVLRIKDEERPATEETERWADTREA